jgi:hypothetical protein
VPPISWFLTTALPIPFLTPNKESGLHAVDHLMEKFQNTALFIKTHDIHQIHPQEAKLE